MSQPLTPRRLAARAVALAASLLGLTRLLAASRRRRGDYRVFILEYHGVDPGDREREGTISQRRFRRHVRWLASRFEILTVAEAAARLEAGSLQGDVLAITFDDGYLNNYLGAWPVLREAAVPATIYLTTGF
ncbi:MAG: polysaccharide deacetylase family protein, partial [Acidobacteriota bacterium]